MKLPSLEEVANAVSKLDIGLKPLGDAAIPVAFATYSVEASPEIKVAGKALQLTAGFDAAIEEYNSLDDADEAGTLGIDPKSKPPIVLTTASAWLKYRLGGSLRLDGGGDIGSIGFSFDAKARIDLFDYRRHAREKVLAEAVVQDLSQPRIIFSLSSVRSLAEGEALALKAAGSLTLGMTLNWADVVTSGLTSLTAALKAAAPVSITLDAGLTTSVEVSLAGDFALLYARDRTGLRIAVKKATSTGLGVSAKVGAAATFTNLDKAVTGVLESLLGAKYEAVVATLQKANPSNLTASERKLFEKVVAQLGLAEEVETVTGLLERISGLKDEVQAKLVEIARSRVEIGLAYEYSRTRTNEVLLDAYVIDDAAFQAVHPHLVRGDVRALLAEVRKPGKLDLRAFLHRSTLETKGSWGFTFSAGKFLKAKGVDSAALVEIEEKNEHDWPRLTYEAVRGYSAAFAGDEYSWTVNFLATMKSFARIPNASDFDYSLHLAYSPTSKPKPADQEFLTDLAALWGAGNLESTGQSDLSAALKEKPGRFAVSQAIPETALAEIAERAAADTDRVLLASAMAAALPYRKEWPERRVLGLRRSLYGPVLHSLIRESSQRPSGLSAVCGWVRDELRRKGASNAFFEGQLNFTGSLVDVLYKQGYFEDTDGFMDHVRAFERGVRSLAKVLGSGAAGVAPNEIKFAYNQMKPFFCQSFFVRTVAHYFFLLAQDAGVAGLVERATSLEHGGGSKILIQ